MNSENSETSETSETREYEFKLPEIGEGVVEGEIVNWLKQPGDAVAANEALVEVMTDKATIEIPSPIAGVLRTITAEVGEICAVGQVIAIFAEGASAPAATPAATPAAATPSAPAAPAAPAADTRSIPATPAARALARESGIDLRTVPVDARGRITKKDILEARARGLEPIPAAPTAVAAPISVAPAAPVTPAPVAATTTAPTTAPPARAAATVEGDEFIPYRGIRRRIAEGIHRSYSTAAHYTYVERVDVTKLVKLRAEAKGLAAEQGVTLSFLPFIVKAVIHGLRKFPIVNAELDEAGGRIIVKKRYNIGVATATRTGLIVPVVHGADRLSILDLAREIDRVAAAARAGKATREELTGGTFTVTSLGKIGGVLATPILNYPEVGILGVHAIRKTPIVDADDNIVIGHIMNLSVSFDHRVVDGFEGASFLQEVRRYLEDPNLLLLAGI